MSLFRCFPHPPRAVFVATTLLYVAGLFLLSDTAGEGISRRLPGPFSNLVHLPTHALLAVLLVRCLRRWEGGGGSGNWPGLRAPTGPVVAALTGLHGLSEEVHQFFVPGRTCSVLDLGLDISGGLLFLLMPWPAGAGRPRSWRPFFGVMAVALALGLVGASGRPFPDRVLEDLLRLFRA